VTATYVAVWTLFLKAFFESGGRWENVAFGIMISSVLLGLWRLNIRRVDGALANLYPDLIVAEGVLKISPEYGTIAYLSRDVPCIGTILGSNSKLTPNRKAGRFVF